MKIFNSKQIKDWDQATLNEAGITGIELMNRAAENCFQWIWHRYNQERPIYIFCGKGNNGGDGLAIGRLLLEEGYNVQFFLTHPVTELSADAKAQFEQLNHLAPIAFPNPDNLGAIGTFEVSDLAVFSPQHIHRKAILIDALFGTGLSSPLKGPVAKLVQSLNQLSNLTIAIDLPSGLAADTLPDEHAVVLQADHTLTIENYKHSLLHGAGASFAGKVHLIDLGLSRTYYKHTHAPFSTTDRKFVRKLYRPRDPFGHKGSFGTAVLVGGSEGKMGSIGMSAKAALRMGAGKAFIQAPKCGEIILQTYLPEAMFQSMGEVFIEYIKPMEKAVFGIGPGLGQEQETLAALRGFMQGSKQALVLDADALNLVAQDPDTLLPFIPKDSILTPHPKEFEGLFGSTANSLEQVKMAQQSARQHQLIIVLKGHHTAVCLPDGHVYYNMTGNAGMGTAGSGDVLTGMITGLLAQNYPPAEAALLAVYLHGLAGDLASKELSKEALIAGDLIDYIGAAYKQLKDRFFREENKASNDM